MTTLNIDALALYDIKKQINSLLIEAEKYENKTKKISFSWEDEIFSIESRIRSISLIEYSRNKCFSFRTKTEKKLFLPILEILYYGNPCNKIATPFIIAHLFSQVSKKVTPLTDEQKHAGTIRIRLAK